MKTWTINIALSILQALSVVVFLIISIFIVDTLKVFPAFIEYRDYYIAVILFVLIFIISLFEEY